MREEADEACHQMKEALKAYEELQKANEELQQILGGRLVIQNLGSRTPRVNVDPQPFTQKNYGRISVAALHGSKNDPILKIRRSQNVS